MKNWWFKLGCFLTGWNSSILGSCTESSRKQLKKYTSAIIILIILWAFIGFSFANNYVHAPWWGCVLVAIIFIIIVIQIERQIILTISTNNKLAAFRIFIAFIMAIIGSVILDQIIFKDDIKKKMIEIVDRQVNEQLPNRLTIIDTKLRELQIEVDSLDKKNLELYAAISARPTIETVSTIRVPVPIRKVNGGDTIIYSTSISKTPISNPKVREADINNKQLEVLRKQQEDFSQRKLDAETSLRNELKANQGFLEELNAIIEILKQKPVALIFYLVLFAFLMSLELFVVISKIADKQCDYVLIIEHQLEQKKKTLNELVR